MAHFAKYTRGACGHLWKHFERAKDENGEYVKFSNESIDPNRTPLNYNLAPIHPDGQGGFVRQRCSEVKCLKRKDVNVMCSWVITAPQSFPEKDLERFFTATYDFLSKRYGKENVVSAYVHMDEVTPHMHFAFVPVVESMNRHGEPVLKVSAKELVTRKELQRFHFELEGHLERVFGYEVGILNEATKNGNKSVLELKKQSTHEKVQVYEKIAQKCLEEGLKLEKQVEHIRGIKDNAEAELEEILAVLKATQENLRDVQQEKELLENEVIKLKKEHIQLSADKDRFNAIMKKSVGNMDTRTELWIASQRDFDRYRTDPIDFEAERNSHNRGLSR